MTFAITRVQVRDALRFSKCPVPDFTTREKTALAWSKVYISIQGDKLRFVALNFFQRIFRYFAGCCCYADTIFADKAILEEVKGYVHGIKTAPAYHDSIAIDLLSKARVSSDYSCCRFMLEECLSVANNRDVIEDLVVLQKEALNARSKTEGFSEEFLSTAIALAKQNLERNSDDKMWESITRVFLSTLNCDAVMINEPLLFEILGLPKMYELPSQQIGVPDEIKNRFQELFKKANETLDSSAATLERYLKGFVEFEKINKSLDNLPEVLRPFLAKESGKQMVLDLRNSLISSRALPSIIKAYLEDEEQIVNRLYYHTDLALTARPSPDLSQLVKEKMEDCKARARVELNCFYEVVDLGPQIDSFSASCNRCQKLTGMTWREKIANEFFRDAEYRMLAKARNAVTLDQYSKWIRHPLSPIGLPELKMLSKITGRPVLIVKLKDDCFEWIDRINLDFDRKPIILNKKKGIWSPVEKLENLKNFSMWEKSSLL